jgi:hypothetical protein
MPYVNIRSKEDLDLFNIIYIFFAMASKPTKEPVGAIVHENNFL